MGYYHYRQDIYLRDSQKELSSPRTLTDRNRDGQKCFIGSKHLSKLLGFIIIDGRVSMVFNGKEAAHDTSNELILNTFIRTYSKRMFSYREQGTIYSEWGKSSFFYPHFLEDDEPSITLFQIMSSSSPYSKWRVADCNQFEEQSFFDM